MESMNLLINTLSIAITALLTGGLVFWFMYKRHGMLRDKNQQLIIDLEINKQNLETYKKQATNTENQMVEKFTSLSSQALKHNSEEFLKLAKENLAQFQIKAQGDLTAKEKAIDSMIKPIKEALEKTEKQIYAMEKDRKEAYGALTQHLETMSQTQQALQGETRNLVKAFSRPEIRGQWGELTLKRLVELAGMVEHCDFYEQQQTTTEEGNQRPDMVIRMPGGREVIVDVKTPLDAYLRAVEASDESIRKKELQHHTRNVRQRIRELANKSYWSQFAKSPDFVVLFIPGDQFLSSALDDDPGLLEHAMQQKIILATPTSLVALLRAIAYGWRQESLTQNAEKIRQVGDELYGRLTTFADHLGKLGKSLNGSVLQFNKAVGSFDVRILPSARKFSEMGISAKNSVESIDQIESTARAIESPEKQKNTEDALS